MSIALCAIGGAPVASMAGAESLVSNGKVPPKRRTLAKPDLALLPEAR